MKHLRGNLLWWWRAALIGCGCVLVGFALFSFLIYTRIMGIAHQAIEPPFEERTVQFSPTLLNDMKTFWGGRKENLTDL